MLVMRVEFAVNFSFRLRLMAITRLRGHRIVIPRGASNPLALGCLALASAIRNNVP